MSNDLYGVLGVMTALCVLGSATVAHAEDDGLNVGHRGIEFKSGDFTVNLGGRLHLDAARVSDAGTDFDDQEVRRARLELGVQFDDWRLRVDREFSNGGGWRNVWASYDVSDAFAIKVGNQIAPFSMEDVGSSNETMFMERSLAQALAPGFGVGVSASYEGRHFGVSGGYFGDAIDAEDNIQGSKGRGVALRATWSPIEHRRNTVHLGVGLERREFETGDVRLVTSGPEASLAPAFVTSGLVPNIDTSMSYNVEAAYSFGPVLAQAQYISTNLSRSAGGDLTLEGYYAQVGWVVTGESHQYGDAAGVFLGPRPRNDWGAVEVAARVSSLDLSEAGAPASGQADDVTVGVNWYIGRNVRLMANYIDAQLDAVNPLLDRSIEVVEARAQLDF